MKKLVEYKTIDEFTEEQQNKILNKYHLDEYFWIEEYLESLKEVLNLIDFKVDNWALSPYEHSYIDISANNNIDQLEKLNVKKFIKEALNVNSKYGNVLKNWQNCPLTGFCADYDLLKIILDNMQSVKNITEIALLVTNKAKELIINEMESQDSNEFKKDFLINNEIYFNTERI